jgi:arginine exporter protein ArgO
MSVTTSRRSTVNTAATLVGAVFLVVGVLGFIPGITTHYSQMEFAGHTSDAKLLGVFEVSVLHNLVHLLFGLVGLAAGRSTSLSAQRFLIGGGVVYLILWIYGLIVGKEAKANFVPLNNADNWLHLALGVGMIALGVTLGRVTQRRLRM